jgi:hypothetical protein
VRNLKAFALGAAAVGALAYTLTAALAVTAQAAGRTLVISLGPFVLVTVARDASAAVTTFGSGLVVVALIGGAANLCAARFLLRSSERRSDRVD